MVEYVLAAALIGVMPARGLCKNFRRADVKTSRPRRYLTSGAIIAALLALLGYCWLHAVRSPALLGLDIPVSDRGMIGFAIAGVVFAVLAVVEFVMKHRGDSASEDKARQKLAGNDLLPRNRNELVLFLGFAVLAGCGWELLYRGFLIWLLTPHIGTVGAVCIAALAYGAAHGFKSRAQFLGSLVSAFAFTIAFVLTASLWWLMLIHSVAGIAGGYGSYKLFSGASEAPLPDGVKGFNP